MGVFGHQISSIDARTAGLPGACRGHPGHSPGHRNLLGHANRTGRPCAGSATGGVRTPDLSQRPDLGHGLGL